MRIPFNKPFITGNELDNLIEIINNSHLAGNSTFTNKCQSWLETNLGSSKALLTHSCTAALEMAAILADIQPGDEIIMPSYTFVSTANAFVLRGGVPVFVDIREDTLNLDETKIEAAITPKTKAIVPVHYAGVACEMDTIMAIAEKYNLFVIEDAAQGIMSKYKGRFLGSIGQMGAISFHETKNIISGEGGALLINDDRFIERAEIIWEKGTNRSKFFRGQVDKYTWVDIGSSYLPSELIAAFLWAQLEQCDLIIKRRVEIWKIYHQAFNELEKLSIGIKRPFVPKECNHNGHLYYLLMPNLEQRTLLMDKLRTLGIQTVFHYVPLHSSAAGIKYGRAEGVLPVTQLISDRVVRMPFWLGIEAEMPFIIKQVLKCINLIFSNQEAAVTKEGTSS